MNILYATSNKQIEQARTLFREYEAFLGINLDFQDFEKELASLPGMYAAPAGALFIVINSSGKAVGCGALRQSGPPEKKCCEMKRLFIRPEARGLGAGRQLALKIIEEGMSLGYSTIVLDTLDRLTAAMGLYQSIGFIRTKPYYDNPLPGVVFWERDLTARY